MPIVTYNWINVELSFFVNDVSMAGDQTLPAIARINGGTSYFNAWVDGGGAIEGRIIENDGDPVGSEFLVNDTIAGVQTDPSVVQLNSTGFFFTPGSIVATYTDYSVDAGGDILARFISGGAGLFGGSALGTPGAEIQINISASNDTDSDIAALANGGFVVTWTRDFGGGDFDIVGGVYNSSGALQASVFVDPSVATGATRSQVVGLANGNFVVVFESEPTTGGSSAVQYRIYSAAGAAVTDITTIDSVGSINEDIQIVALADGGFAVAYADNGWFGSDQTEITLRFFNADGSTRTNYIQVNTNNAGAQANPTLTTLSNGYVVVGWTDLGALYQQAYTPAGIAMGTNDHVFSAVVSGEFIGLTGGLIANVRESTMTDGSGNSIRTSIDELLRSTVGDATNETLVGDSLRDTIIGGAGDDTISGGSNADTLTGGTGLDRFRDTASNLNGDIITDWSLGDRIQVTDANLAGFTTSYAAGTLTFTGGSVALTVAAENRVIARAAVGGGVEVLLANADYDFNGDGRSDMIWRHSDSAVSTWLGQSNGSFAFSAGSAANPLDSSWQIKGVGDFNGDGKDDVLWRHSSGEIGQWLGQPSSVFANNGGAAANAVDNSWIIAGIADYNGDGRDDILWRHNSGEVGQWLGQPSGGFANNGGAAANLVDISWTVLATGDFNGDGRSDILWRHESGAYSEWHGSATGALVNAGAVALGSGSVVGSGDFNGDGRDDVLTRAGDGSISVWLGQSNGQFTAFTPGLQLNDLSWKIVGIGDYNGDAKEDLLWRHSSGEAGEWLGAGTGDFINNGAIPSINDGWQVQSPDLWMV